MSSDPSDEIAAEQRYVARLYTRLDALRESTDERLASTLAQATANEQALGERDTAVGELSRRVAQLNAVEGGLCFGRLDMRDGEQRYVGRLSILDEESDYAALLTDWRAPAARPFYVATAVSPEGVVRRRHLRTSGRTVTGVQDEVLGGDGRGPDGEGAPDGDAALLAALGAARTGRMADIVATIQAEQDEIIRARHAGVLVVQGGPGTGKTAVALHRAAYLLYTHRERLAKSVVLVVGPNATFLRYIGEVLPSLGETGVLLASPGELFPGVTATAVEPPEAAEVKGRAAMAETIAAAVRDRQAAPDDGLAVEHDGGRIELSAATCRRLRERARSARLPHNEARPLYGRLLVAALADALAELIGADPLGGPNLLGEEDVAQLRRELADSPAVAAALEELWPALTPQRLVAELFADPDRLASAAPELDEAERALLRRAPDAGWTPADVPLLDEAAELLGVDDRAARAAAAAERAERLTLAQEALDVAYGSRVTDLDDGAEEEYLSAFDLVDAERLAARHDATDHRTPAERAAADRTWAFGHVVVDEAQELSAMDWRLLMRRCPTKSLTVVGDIAQTGRPGDDASWSAVLAPHVGDRWRLAELSVNYRLPSEIAAVAEDVLRAIDPSRTAPRAVRSTGVRPWRRAVPAERLAAVAAESAAREAAAVPEGSVAVLAPRGRLAPVERAVAAGGAPAERVRVLDVDRAKGLEFDVVLVVDPASVVAESPRGLNDLYVALSRPTQRLGVLHPDGALPAALAGLTGLTGPDAAEAPPPPE